MTPKALLAALPLAFATLTAALPAAAADIVLVPTGTGSYAASFTQLANGFVLDDFTFAPLAFDSTFSVMLASLSGPVTFAVGVLFPDTNDEMSFANLTDTAGGDFSFSGRVAAATPVTLRVFGAVNDADGNPVGTGSYSVSVTAAVPEPSTVALLLAGLVGVGVATRRRLG